MSNPIHYTSVDFNNIKSVKLVSFDDTDFQKYREYQVNNSKKRRKQAIPKEVQLEFVKRFEYLMNNIEKVRELYNEVVSFYNECKYCRFSREDKFSNNADDLICWEFDKTSFKPTKIKDKTSICNRFDFAWWKTPIRDNERLDKITSSYIFNRNDFRSNCMGWAWFFADQEAPLSIRRLEALLRDYNSKFAKYYNTQAFNFEKEIRDTISKNWKPVSDKRIFKIKYRNGTLLFKVADIIFSSMDLDFILEVYAGRDFEEKKQQLMDYGRLFEIVTGREPFLILISFGIESEKGDNGFYSHEEVIKIYPLNYIELFDCSVIEAFRMCFSDSNKKIVRERETEEVSKNE